MWNVSFFFPSPFQVINVLLKISELKDLQNTHDTLVVEVQTLLDTHVHLRQRVQQPQPVERSLPPTASFPKFFTRLKSRPKTRARSNTVGFTTSDSPNVDSAPFDVTVTASQEAYNRFVEAFWSINYKYKVSWECAELLIELGSGSVGADGDGVGVVSAPTSAATTSVSAPAIQQHLTGTGEGTIFNLKGRERAITLAGDESKQSTTPPLSPTAHYEPENYCQSLPPSAIVSTGSNSMSVGVETCDATSNGGPPLTSPLTSQSSTSWRASTGRHDLSQRQLVLLREMMSNNGDASIVGAFDNEGGLHPPPANFPILAEEGVELRPSMYPSPYSQFVNRDWKWGDARNSTISFSESGIGAEGVGGDGKMDKEKRRRSVKLGMGGIRDMLRSLKKGHKLGLQQTENSNPGEVQSTQQCNHHVDGRFPAAVALAQPTNSTTSLSTKSSIGSKSVHNQAQVHQQQNPISRIPSQIQRRGRSSTGPESMRSNKGPSPINPSFFTAPKHGKSTGEEEEDWDRMDLSSDLDAAAIKALGIADGTFDGSATVRGRGRGKAKADEKKPGVSPYLQNQSSHENDQHHPPPLPASSSSTGLGNFFTRHSIMPKRSFSASQLSIFGGAGSDGQLQHPPNVPSRLSRHSNYEQKAANNERPASFRIPSSKSVPITTQSKLPSSSNTPGSSRPSSSRSTKFPNAKTGSVRSMLPHLVPSSLVATGLQGQPSSSLSSLPDPKLGMMMTPENIKPLLENAKEVHVKLHECIVEIRALIDSGAAAIGQAPPTC